MKNHNKKLNDSEKRKILKKVAEVYKSAEKQKEFIPGVTSINYAGRVYNEAELISLVDASLDFWLTAGRCANEFERKLSKFLGTKYCLLTNSGSSANLLAISALASPLLKSRQLKPGDEVITTACSFPTTLNPIIQNNLIPCFIDVDVGTYNIKAEKIEGAITKKTKAIFIAHTLGNPVDIDKIMKIAKKHGLWFIEDNCDALGSEYKGQFTGTFGHISTCSFYPAHHITMGEGGAVLTSDTLLRKIIISFRDWGRDCWCESGHDNTCGKRFKQQFGSLPFGYDHKYVYSHIGYNLKITDLQAAIGVAQLKKLLHFVEARKKNFEYLYNQLKKYEKFLILPRWSRDSKPSWFGFPLTVRNGISRLELIRWLEAVNIKTRLVFAGNIIRQPAYKNIKYRVYGTLKDSDRVMKDTFFIGVYPGLSSPMLAFVVKRFEDFFKKNNLTL